MYEYFVGGVDEEESMIDLFWGDESVTAAVVLLVTKIHRGALENEGAIVR